MKQTYKYAGKNPSHAGNLHGRAGFDTQSTLLTTCFVRQHHIVMQRVQKETSDVISLVYIFCIEFVDFFVGIYLR